MKNALLILIIAIFLIHGSAAQVSQNTTLIGHWGKWYGNFGDMEVLNNYAFVGSGTTLLILDISDPEVPVEISATHLPSQVQGIAVSGNYAYVADGEAGLLIINISDRSKPVITGNLSSDNKYFALDVLVTGNYAYMSRVSNFLSPDIDIQIISVFNPSNPVQVGQFKPFDLNEFVVSGSYAYVSNSLQGLQIFNVSDPSYPFLSGQLDMQGNTTKLSLSGSYVYMANNGMMKIIDVSDPANPFQAGILIAEGEICDLVASGNYAYLLRTDGYPGYAGEIIVSDISDPISPVRLGTCSTPGMVYVSAKLYISENNAFVPIYGSGLSVYDITNPSYPRQSRSYDTPGTAVEIALDGNFAYLAALSAGLEIIDISNPLKTSMTGAYDTPGEASAVAISGNYCFIADGSAGLRVINISDPEVPFETGFYDTPGNAADVFLSGNLAFVADGENGLLIIDVSHPSSPQLIESINIPGGAMSVDVVGYYAYVAAGQGGMRIINVSRPEFPYEVGYYQLTDPYNAAMDVKVSGNYAYIAYQALGIHIVDVSNPESPYEAGYYDTRGIASDISVVGNMLFLADGEGGYGGGGFRMIDVSNPEEVVETGYYITSGANGIAINNNQIYIANGNGGMIILRSDLAGSAETPQIDPITVSCNPNPCNYHTTISFTLKSASLVRLEMLNSLGQPVSVLEDQFLPAGAHQVDVNTDRFINGVYFYRLKTNGQITSGKMMVIK